MWLWYVRNEDFEGATIWLTKAGDFPVVSGDNSMANIFTALYLLEGMMLYIVCKVDQRNVRAVSRAYDEVSTLMRNLEKASKKVKIILPRWVKESGLCCTQKVFVFRLYHLKAYYRYIRYADNTCFGVLNTARKYAERYKDLLELGWIEHSEKVRYGGVVVFGEGLPLGVEQ